MNVVIIPCYDRPEFLAITLEQIEKANNSNKFLYLFTLDNGYDKECEDVINKFPLKKIITKRKKTKLTLGKQSYNLLEAYREACILSSKYVLLIEDDILITNDFFDFHINVHEQNPNAFCSIGAENHNTKFDTIGDDSFYYYGSITDYQSWGVCWNKDVLEALILPHANDEYYFNPVGYLIKVFNQNWIGQHFAEQDGLIRRVRYCAKELPVIFPHVPRCFHAGFYSYHRNKSKRFKNSLEKKIKMVKEVISSEENYKKFCENEDFYNDSKLINLDHNFKYDLLTLKQI